MTLSLCPATQEGSWFSNVEAETGWKCGECVVAAFKSLNTPHLTCPHMKSMEIAVTTSMSKEFKYNFWCHVYIQRENELRKYAVSGKGKHEILTILATVYS